MFVGLFRGEDLHKALGKNIKSIGMGQVEMEGCGIELGKDVDLPETETTAALSIRVGPLFF
ncbi:hypothetical protein AGMMS4952_25350 [Spirochaetia bacterium]|nr:hypothetical protein AGMMS4952_25350 [Spirochaetia bacterium]